LRPVRSAATRIVPLPQKGIQHKAAAAGAILDRVRDQCDGLDGRMHRQFFQASRPHGVDAGIVPNVRAIASMLAELKIVVEHFHAERNDQGKGNVLLFPRDTNIRREGPVHAASDWAVRFCAGGAR
jgi:hypothetical protein